MFYTEHQARQYIDIGACHGEGPFHVKAVLMREYPDAVSEPIPKPDDSWSETATASPEPPVVPTGCFSWCTLWGKKREDPVDITSSPRHAKDTSGHVTSQPVQRLSHATSLTRNAKELSRTRHQIFVK